jgi:hypothetical protein
MSLRGPHADEECRRAATSPRTWSTPRRPDGSQRRPWPTRMPPPCRERDDGSEHPLQRRPVRPGTRPGHASVDGRPRQHAARSVRRLPPSRDVHDGRQRRAGPLPSRPPHRRLGRVQRLPGVGRPRPRLVRRLRRRHRRTDHVRPQGVPFYQGTLNSSKAWRRSARRNGLFIALAGDITDPRDVADAVDAGRTYATVCPITVDMPGRGK